MRLSQPQLSRSASRTVAAISTLAALIVVAGLTASPASAAQTTAGGASAAQAGAGQPLADAPVGWTPAGQARTAAALADRLGARAAGAYLDDSSGRMVVAVTDAAAVADVRAAGMVPSLVARGRAQLAQATADLAASATIPGTAWAVDLPTNQVVVSYDATVTGERLARLRAAVDRLGGAARLESVGGEFSTTIAGGDAIYTSGGRCSLGFNVRSGNTYGFLTAGHCGNIGATWYADSSGRTVLGTRVSSSFPGNDFALIKYTNSSVVPDGTVDLYGSSQDITSAGDAYVGQAVRRSGSTTKVRSGTVTGLNATVNYSGGGSVSGLIKTTVCAEKGDSGGALFAGSTALGLTSGGNGNCTSGGTTYFQPVTEALATYGVSVF